MSTAAAGLSLEELRATIKESVQETVKEAVTAGFLEHGHALANLQKDVKDVFAMVAGHHEDTAVLKE
eukprot:663339-Prorocentrum_lima.AAC.1